MAKGGKTAVIGGGTASEPANAGARVRAAVIKEGREQEIESRAHRQFAGARLPSGVGGWGERSEEKALHCSASCSCVAARAYVTEGTCTGRPALTPYTYGTDDLCKNEDL
jgi:hypothetical protein